ncbi:Nucleolar Complex 2 protein [Elasticomyces elasticus]|nr:Nucleolar Complex 2 protein [Elasticomyces elasticus]KAK3635996.1 Nucleolar Complex 2 protein [Elasticomyces elasticus]KAK4916639.1 Nucleolar Complex 2 protein [Elasticomyces elasticus]KAK5754913.1 Nucleolar Complex 2 protein [Elasticomyces elasticus]
MAQSKATKKFEKHHLKDVLEKRKGLKKTKQQQQLKARKQARRVEENGGAAAVAAASEEAAKDGVKKSEKDAFKDMTVDDFFQGGFEVPELPKKKGGKRKRNEEVDEEESVASVEEQPVVGDGEVSGSEDSEGDDDHKQQLDALAENDPEFHKYLQENEPELLDGELAEIGDLSDGSDEPKRKKQKKQKKGEAEDSDDEMEGAGKNELDKATVKRWQKALTEQHSLRAAKEVVLAFRVAAHISEDEEKDFKYSISDPNVYHLLLTTALTHIPAVFEHHLPVVESQKSGKAHVPTESKKFKTLAPLLRSQISSIIHLLDNLSDPATLRLTLSSTLPLLPYLLSFKKLVRDTARAAAAVWSTPSSPEATRIAAFLLLRRLIVIGDPGIRENVLKATYQALVKGSRNTTIHTMAGVNLMKNSAAELWGLCAASGDGVAYTTSFTFIRQLAIHLRGSITNNSNDSYKTVYNWQYVHSLDFWSRVLASYAVESTSALRPLIYPLVQVTLGAMRLIPTATYFPLRFQLIRALLRISLTTGTYIPLAPALYEVLNSAEMRKAPKAATVKPLDFGTAIRAPKAYLRTRIYQDGVGEQVVELLGEFFVLWTKNIAFPELALPVIIMLKRWLKEVNNRAQGKGNKNQKVNTSVQLLVQKLEANGKWVEEKRAKVEFAPNDRRGVDGFLKDVEWTKSPLGAFVVGQRKTREERARVLDESRREDERREAKGKGKEEKVKVKGKKVAREVDSEEEDEEESEDDGGSESE